MKASDTILTAKQIDEVIIKVWEMSKASQDPFVRENTLKWAKSKLCRLTENSFKAGVRRKCCI